MKLINQHPRLAVHWLRTAKAAIAKHEVLAYPTESCFGFGCHPQDVQGIHAILALKKRPQHKGLIVIAAKLEQLQPLLRPLSQHEQQALQTAFDQQTRPTTFLLHAHDRVLPVLRGHHDKIAVRLTQHPEARALCLSLGHALVSTSANEAGKHSIRRRAELIHQFGDRCLILPGQCGANQRPSTLIDYETGRILRP